MTQRMRLQLRHVNREGKGWKALPKLPRDAGQPWAQVYSGPKHVVFGHHARRRLQVTYFTHKPRRSRILSP